MRRLGRDGRADRLAERLGGLRQGPPSVRQELAQREEPVDHPVVPRRLGRDAHRAEPVGVCLTLVAQRIELGGDGECSRRCREGRVVGEQRRDPRIVRRGPCAAGDKILVRSKMQSAGVYLDGPYQKIGVRLGDVTSFEISDQPLTVLGLDPNARAVFQ